MRFDLRLLLPALALLTPNAGCLPHQCDAYAAAGEGAPAPTSTATQTLAEADIVQVDETSHRVFALSRSGSLTVVDAAEPQQLTLLGKTTLAGRPFEMVRRGDVLVTMSNQAVTSDGQVVAPAAEGAALPAYDDRYGSLLTVIDAAHPESMKVLATLKIPGEVSDSRLAGDILYVTTFQNVWCYGCNSEARTFLTSFDLRDPSAPRQVDQIDFGSNTNGGYGAFLPWKRSLHAVAGRLYLGGVALNPEGGEGIIDVVDVSDATGKLKRGATLRTAGPILNRWQMDEVGGVLRVITQLGDGRVQNGLRAPELDTFRLDSATSFARLGHLELSLPRQEGLKTVRFDGTRAYAITFEQTDPLFTFDLSDPKRPAQKGSLEMPGWVFHLEPRGELLVGLGLDRRDAQGNLNVALFDVSDLATPHLVARQAFGPTDGWADSTITDLMMAEDKDRIQKAFRVFDDGLIAVPFNAPDFRGDGCGASFGGIQLLELTKTSLVKRGLLPMNGHPRRALRRDGAEHKEILGISDSNAAAFTIDDRDAPVMTANVTIGACTPRGNEGVWRGVDDNWEGGMCE